VQYAVNSTVESAPPRGALIWLLLAAILPNLGTLGGSFLYDDLPVIVQNARLHSLARIGEIWTHGYWPDRPGLTLYRPVSQTVWSLLWAAGGGGPWPFHALNLILGSAVVVLIYWLLIDLRAGGRTAFFASLLFAVLPLHAEVTAAIISGSELLAAFFGLGALLLYRRGRLAGALCLYVLAVLSKESAAAVAGLGLLFPYLVSGPRSPFEFRRTAVHAIAAATVIGLALWARAAVAEGAVFIPPIDNPMALLQPPQRILTALWVQVLYVWKALVPITLSADYSYKQIPLVMGLQDVRAWGGLAFAAIALWAFLRRAALRLGLALWMLAFLPAANLLMPIGTIMGERLAYLPSVGLALLLAESLGRLPRKEIVLAGLALVFAARTWVRDRDWHDADAFYPKLAQTSPQSTKTHYFLGCYLAARERPAEALIEYNRAIAIFPAYPEALNNRGCILVTLGRLDEAKASFRECLRFNPSHSGAAASLAALEAGMSFVPAKPPI
jgi:tetratricopeptide (TPR) repeat protein